jgi:hypothetical protein
MTAGLADHFQVCHLRRPFVRFLYCLVLYMDAPPYVNGIELISLHRTQMNECVTAVIAVDEAMPDHLIEPVHDASLPDGIGWFGWLIHDHNPALRWLISPRVGEDRQSSSFRIKSTVSDHVSRIGARGLKVM